MDVIIDLAQYYCRILIVYYTQNIDASLLLMSEHLTKDAPQETLFKTNDPWITSEKDAILYTLEHLDNMKLSISEYLAISIITLWFLHRQYVFSE